MNRFAGVASVTLDSNARAQRLRHALRHDASRVEVRELGDHVSVAWCGNGLTPGFASIPGCAAAIFGGAIIPTGNGSSTTAVDDSEKAAEALALRFLSGWGGILQGVSGSFFAALVGRQGELTLLCDPASNRPLFSGTLPDGSLAFATHPVACARILGTPELDRSREDFLLVYGFLPDGLTVCRNVRALAVGEALRWNDSGSLTRLPMSGTNRVPNERAPVANEEELEESLYDVLARSLEEQLPAAKEVGVLLGGFDSALVAAMLHRLGKRVVTYSFSYPESRFNQPHTDTLARFLGSTHRWVQITPDIIADGMRRYAAAAPHPTNWLNYVVQTMHVCDTMRREGITHVYSGDGCDSIFLGYPGTYQRTRIFSRLPSLPPVLVKMAVSLLGRHSLDRWLGHPYRMTLNMLRATGRPMPARAFLTFRILDEISLRQLRTGNSPPQAESVEEIVLRLASTCTGTSLERLGYAAKGLVSPNKSKIIASTDSSGVQIFTPYLHPAVRSFAAAIPDHLLRKRDQSNLADPGKIILMRMAERMRVLPDTVIHQPKLAAIDSPIDDWFARNLRAQLEEMLRFLPFTPDRRYLDSLIQLPATARFYRSRISSTNVLSDPVSLLATYAAFNRELSNMD